MTLKELETADVCTLTTIEDPWGYPIGLAWPDGTKQMCEPSRVGSVVDIMFEGQFEIVWDGGMPDPKGGHTKGTLL